MLCATVKAVTVFRSIQRSLTISNSPSTKSMWSALNTELDCWVDFKRKRVFRYGFVLAATFVSLFADVAAESRIPGVWESYGSPLVPSEWKAILPIAILRRQTKRGQQGHAPT